MNHLLHFANHRTVGIGVGLIVVGLAFYRVSWRSEDQQKKMLTFLAGIACLVAGVVLLAVTACLR